MSNQAVRIRYPKDVGEYRTGAEFEVASAELAAEFHPDADIISNADHTPYVAPKPEPKAEPKADEPKDDPSKDDAPARKSAAKGEK